MFCDLTPKAGKPRLAADSGWCKHLIPPRLKPGVRQSSGQSEDGEQRVSFQTQWRDEFELTGQNPVAWQLLARTHLASANILREHLRATPSANGEELKLRLVPVFLLLGYALENLVKGLLVARGQTATWDGSFDENRKSTLAKGLKHHCLPELCRMASVKTNAVEKRLLEDLRDAIESEKYPVGVRPRSRKRTLGASHDTDVALALGLFKRMELSLRHINLDLVLAPCDPTTFGIDQQAFAKFQGPA